MRHSTIAVCLLLLVPLPAFACFDHPGVPAGWLEERPRSAWDLARGAAEETRWEELLGAASLAAGSGAMLLVVVSLRSARRGRKPPREPAAPPLGRPFDRPVRPVRVDPGHERPPAALTRTKVPSGQGACPPCPDPV